jgi:hypothetical protein
VGSGGKPTLRCGHLPLKYSPCNSHQAFKKAASGAQLSATPQEIAPRKGEKAKKELKASLPEAHHHHPSELCSGGALRRSVAENRADAEAGRLLEHFEHFLPLVEQGIVQAIRRVSSKGSTSRLPRSS